MKLFFKLIVMMTLTATAFSREIIVLSYSKKDQRVEYTIDFLEEKLSPEMITQHEMSRPCEDTFKDAVLHLCFTQDMELIVVRQKKEVLKRTFTTFINGK